MNERYERLLDAIEHERKAEEAYFRNLSQNKTIKEKVESGVCWYPSQLLNNRYTIGEFLEIELERVRHQNAPHKLKTGTRVIVWQRSDDQKEFAGTISFVKRNKIGIILVNDDFIRESGKLNGNFGVEMIYDERPYQVMRDVLRDVIKSKDEHVKEIKRIIAGIDNTSHTDQIELNIPELNESQNKALNGALTARRISIIHGPPGTGKTTTLVSTVRALLKTEKRILVCSSSNNAVDLLARQLDAKGIKVLRIGNVTRIGDSISHLTLAEQARNHTDWQHIKKVKIEAQEAKRQAKTHKRKFGHQERAFRKSMYQESRELMRWARDLEDRLTSEVINNAQAICCTLIGLSNKQLDGILFNTAVIDEASQTLEAECWNAMLRSKRVIFAGDHLQLPPTVKSPDAMKLGLDTTLLDELSPRITNCHLLQIQYRMNNKILGFSNEQFYERKLLSDESVANQTLPNDGESINFIDTSGCGFNEVQDAKSRSYQNEGEYFILREHIIIHEEKYKPFQIGVIAPYAQQVRFIRNQIAQDTQLRQLNIEVDTIDGFQGQEKDIIIISLVRSNLEGTIGFLKDPRRLNVALTRAKYKLIVIGDGATLSQHQLFSDLMNHFEQNGLYQSAWEYMSGNYE